MSYGVMREQIDPVTLEPYSRVVLWFTLESTALQVADMLNANRPDQSTLDVGSRYVYRVGFWPVRGLVTEETSKDVVAIVERIESSASTPPSTNT